VFQPGLFSGHGVPGLVDLYGGGHELGCSQCARRRVLGRPQDSGFRWEAGDGGVRGRLGIV
jgi:hypothetical protein